MAISNGEALDSIWVAPSILSADAAQFGDEALRALKAGADLIHFDVMDNHYVPNLTFGPGVCGALNRVLTKEGFDRVLDVHLMCQPVDSLVPMFAEAGARYISFHPEASHHVHRTIRLIQEHGCQVGIALNPATPVYLLDPIMDEIDMVLIMSVNPGFSGQRFISSALPKIGDVRSKIEASGRDIRLEVDGGVNLETVESVVQAGADTLVMGSAFFGSQDYSDLMRGVRSRIGKA